MNIAVRYSNAALARAIGSSDAEDLANALLAINDPAATRVLSYAQLTTTDAFLDDPPLVWVDVDTEVDRILAAHPRPR